MTREQRGQLGGALLMLANPRVQRSNTAQRQEAVERRAGETEAVRPVDHFFDNIVVGRNEAPANNVTVPVDVLRRGVNDEIRAELDRVLQCR